MSELSNESGPSSCTSSVSTPCSVKKSRTKHQTRRKKVACVECRQQKSKCDAHERAPEPCTRCLKKGIPCVLQKDFVRTCKRERTEVIEQKFRQLAQSLSNLGSEDLLKKLDVGTLRLHPNQNRLVDGAANLSEQASAEKSPSRSHEPLQRAVDQQDHLTDGSFRRVLSTNDVVSMAVSTGPPDSGPALDSPIKLTAKQLECLPKTLGDVTLSSRDIADLFNEFVTKYHPFLPVVDVKKGPERIYSLSPCLFWVIILVGLRRKFEAIEVMNTLSNMVKSVLAEITISPIIRYTPSETDEPVLNVSSVYSVQAFLVYTYWPPLTSSLSADTSWNTIGSAMFQALRVGLNSAQFSTEYASANSQLIHEQIRTWICCNIISQTISSSFGFPAYVSFDHTVINVCNLSTQNDSTKDFIPFTIKQMLHIAHFENQIVDTMNSNPRNASGLVADEEKLPLLQVLNRQLKELELQLDNTKLDDMRRFLLLVTKVHLLTYYFSNDDNNEDFDSVSAPNLSTGNEGIKFGTKRGLVMTYNAAVQLLLHTKNMWKCDPLIVKYLPGVYVLNIWQAASIVSKLVHSSLGSVIDAQSGREMYQDAISLVSNASVLKYDMAYRSAGIMRSIWSMFNNMFEEWKAKEVDAPNSGLSKSDFNLTITIKSRMSVSVFFDCLFILRQKCGMAKLKREREKTVSSDDENGADVNPGLNGPRDILSDDRHPEEHARKIISTIPLDPVPINAHQSSSSSHITSPNSSHSGDVLSLKSILNKTSPKIQTQSVQQSPVSPQISNSADKLDGETVSKARSLSPNLSHKVARQRQDVSNEASATLLNYPNLTSQSLSDLLLQPLPHTSEQLAHSLQSISNTVQKKDTQPAKNDALTLSPGLAERWDNWESDLVWKDVDIIMNEFAFNPTI